MRKMLLCLLVTALATSMLAQAQKLTLSVMDINITRGLAPNEVLMLTDKLLNEFVTNGIYKVVERSKRDEILKEQGFQQSGACDQGACLVEAGQLLGVQKMVGGTIGKLGTVYAVELRMMDVKTGEIDRAFSRQYSGDVSKLLAAMREAAKEFSQGKVDIQVPLLKVPEVSEGLTYVSTNSQGYKEYRNEKDGSILIEIPAGQFTMGSNDDDDEKPIHTLYLDKYYISKYEVTNAQYKKFCDVIRHSQPDDPDISGKPQYFTSYPNYPVVNISWDDAAAYCYWAGLRLPTEAEWEKAARGTDGRKYPWGNEWDSTKCNSAGKCDNYENISPVGSFPSGVSPYGVYDMAGNAFEWCNDWYDNEYYGISPIKNPAGPSAGFYRVLRGGAFWFFEGPCRSTARDNDKPSGGLRLCIFGFRPSK